MILVDLESRRHRLTAHMVVPTTWAEVTTTACIVSTLARRRSMSTRPPPPPIAHPRNRLKVAPSPCLLSMKELLLSSSEFSPLGRHFLFCLQPPVSIQFQTFHSLIHNVLEFLELLRMCHFRKCSIQNHNIF